MIRSAIIHFAPLELYPPVQNLLVEVGKYNSSERVIVFTTRTTVAGLQAFSVDSEKIRIVRLGESGQKLNIIARYVVYVYFYTVCLLLLLWRRPKSILYFEAISSFPAYVYKKFFCHRCAILIHYHEYTSPDELRNGMKLVNYFHRLEKELYPQAVWVSHTNEFRMKKFKKDNDATEIKCPYILPNFPPRTWASAPAKHITLPLRIVYVGALSLETMYTREFSEWVLAQNGKVIWDIYSYNFTDEARTYLYSLNTEWIKLKGGVNYYDLPRYLQKYHVGVILYNGHIPNYVYNAPNKLFEYLASGLSVWFPDIMTGSKTYCTNGTYPEILALDFSSLNTIKVEQLIAREGHQLKRSSYYCEDALQEIIRDLLK